MNIESALKNLDNPIRSFEEDLLQRRGFVQMLCRIFAAASPSESTVFALYGEWGAGKTSAKNLLLKELAKDGEKAPIPIEFNPWAFSGQDQVLEAFFSEIGKSVGQSTGGKDAAEKFKKLGAYLSFGAKSVKALHVGMDLFGIPGAKLVGLVGEQLDGGAKSAKEYGEDIGTVGQISLEKIQKELTEALAKLERPLLIVLDDLDRLPPEQLLTIFQIVKLNANLPRVNYLLLMDAETIAKRLAATNLGAEYIEKIVQFDLSLPHVTADELKAILKKGFESVMGKYAAQIDWERWEEAWTNGTQNLFTTLRQIKRFLHTLKFHISIFASDDVLEVDPVDLFLVETVRKFAPEVHAAIPRVLGATICPDEMESIIQIMEHKNREHEYGKREFAGLKGLAREPIRNEIEQILKVLFPQIGNLGKVEGAEREWIRDARICHQLFFNSYFRMIISEEMPSQQESKELFDAAGNADQLRPKMVELYKRIGLHSLLLHLQCHHKKLKPADAARLLAEIWRLDDLDAKAAGVEGQGGIHMGTQAVTRFFLKQVVPKNERATVALQAMDASNATLPLAMFWRDEWGSLKENPHANETAFSQQDLEQLKAPLVKSIQEAAKHGRLLEMPDLRLFLYVWQTVESREAVMKWIGEVAADPKKLARILSTFVGKTTSTDFQGKQQAHFSLSRKAIESFFNPIENIEDRLKQLDVSTLGHWERFAVKEALGRIEEKRGGIDEVEYPGM